MKTIDQLIADVIAREGDYAAQPADRGGATRWGITEQVARANGYAGDMKVFPRDTAAAIYRATFWTRPSFDQVASILPNVAAELFDTGVNMGVVTASIFLQRSLNVLNQGASLYPNMAVDGHIGPLTIVAIKALVAKRGAMAEAVLLKALNGLQAAKYIAIAEKDPTQEAFVYGWLANRVGAEMAA